LVGESFDGGLAHAEVGVVLCDCGEDRRVLKLSNLTDALPPVFLLEDSGELPGHILRVAKGLAIRHLSLSTSRQGLIGQPRQCDSRHQEQCRRNKKPRSHHRFL
jgi:hypothetical protein